MERLGDIFVCGVLFDDVAEVGDEREPIFLGYAEGSGQRECPVGAAQDRIERLGLHEAVGNLRHLSVFIMKEEVEEENHEPFHLAEQRVAGMEEADVGCRDEISQESEHIFRNLFGNNHRLPPGAFHVLA